MAVAYSELSTFVCISRGKPRKISVKTSNRPDEIDTRNFLNTNIEHKLTSSVVKDTAQILFSIVRGPRGSLLTTRGIL